MGYSHYWQPEEDTKEFTFSGENWQKIKDALLKIVRQADSQGIDLELGMDREVIWINGVDESHENFVITKSISGFSFCKTARKPYDSVVTALLIYAHSIAPSLEISSDGETEDWYEGKYLLESALNLPFKIPLEK